MKPYLITIHLKSGDAIRRQIETEASLETVKENFDEELKQEIFSIYDGNESISIPIDNVSLYQLEICEEQNE